LQGFLRLMLLFVRMIAEPLNDTKDNDTIAAIVGAAIGALHGRKEIPNRWIDNLSGRTTDRDEGHIFELIEDARSRFWLEAVAQQSDIRAGE
jgi:hypothetical protein